MRRNITVLEANAGDTTMQWQPIETAPRNQNAVLLYCPVSVDTDGVRVGWWSIDGWYDVEWASHKLTDFHGEPTHWMPLPKPPVLTGS